MIPKFRVWDKKLKLIRNVRDIDFQNQEVGFYVDDYESEDYISEFGISRSFDEIELMQSTGLKDKNGVEIFEGDIVENTTQIVYMGDKFEVVWNKNYACYQLLHNNVGTNIPLMQDMMSYEVIGNIYENKELLKD